MNKFFQALAVNFQLINPKSIVLRRSSGALGDNLMLSFLAREIKNQYPHFKVIVETERPELFQNNPYIDKVVVGKLAVRYYKMNYQINPQVQTHILDQLINALPIKISEWHRKLDLFLAQKELKETKKMVPQRFVAIGAAGKQTFASNRKEWSFDKFAELRTKLSGYKIVQLGGPDDPLLPDVVDHRGLDIRTTAAIIYLAETGLFLEGGLMHLANAVAKPCVIIFGGALDPEITGYETNINIATKPHCSPCFTSHQAMDTCQTMECMKAISVDTVFQAVNELIATAEKSGKLEVKN